MGLCDSFYSYTKGKGGGMNEHDWQAQRDKKNPGYAKWVCLVCGTEKRGMNTVTTVKCKAAG